MSNENENENENEEVIPTPEEETVSKKAYLEKSKDMHKFKTKAKDALDRANAAEAELEAIKDAKMAEGKQFEELAEKNRIKAEEATALVTKVLGDAKNLKKLSALESYVGGFVKKSYAVFPIVDVSKIDCDDDGNPLEDSVKEYGDFLIQDSPEIIKKTSARSLPNGAPGTSVVEPEVLNVAKLGKSEKEAYYAKQARERLKGE